MTCRYRYRNWDKNLYHPHPPPLPPPPPPPVLDAKIVSRHICACLSALPLLPPRDYQDLRAEVFAINLLHRPPADVSVALAALDALPLFLAAETPDDFRKEVVHSILTPALEKLDSSPAELRERFPRVFGECVCAFARCAVAKVALDERSWEVAVKVVCRFCNDSDHEEEEEETARVLAAPKHLKDNLEWVQPFFALLDTGDAAAPHPSPATRRHFVLALHRVFAHVRVENQFKSFVDATLKTLADPDYDVRMTLAHLVPRLTQNRPLLKTILRRKDEASSK